MRREKITLVLVSICFFGFCVGVWGKPPSELSVTERRKLAAFPQMELSAVMDGTFMTEFESYALDQFPLRDRFRALKAWFSQEILHTQDHHEIYVCDGYAVKMEYPLNEDSLDNAAAKFEKLYERYLKEQGCPVYAAIIPDKNYFLAEKSGHLSMDYERLFERMQENMPYAEQIDLTGLLDITDYYRTDIHWRQEALADVAEKIGECMGIPLADSYEIQTLEEPFYGVYFGQAALDLQGESLSYLTNETLAQCSVYHYETENMTGIYDLKKAEGKDPYEVFLSGPVSLLKIENPNAASQKELVVFRDSFGSSLVPLLTEGYRTITLVDIRYIQSGILDRFVDFRGKDVLFLYSTNVLNHSETFK